MMAPVGKEDDQATWKALEIVNMWRHAWVREESVVGPLEAVAGMQTATGRATFLQTRALESTRL